MSIELHCPRCSRLIRAPDDAGGKRGKCPYCEASVYIPTPLDDDGDIPLAPLDKADAEHEAKLRREAAAFAASLDKAKDLPPDRGGPESGQSPGAAAPPPPGIVVDLAEGVKSFVLAMRDSKLDEADRVVEELKQAGPRARDYVEGLMLDQMPPTIERVSPALMQGFLKALLGRLG
jgi:hypothetical protein